MENVSHSGSGKFGYKVIWKNGLIAYSWFETEEQRNAAFKQARSKDKNKADVKKVDR